MLGVSRAPAVAQDTTPRAPAEGPAEGGGGNGYAQVDLALLDTLMGNLALPKPNPIVVQALFERLSGPSRALVMRDRNMMPKVVNALSQAPASAPAAPSLLESGAGALGGAAETLGGAAAAFKDWVLGADEGHPDAEAGRQTNGATAAKTPAPAAKAPVPKPPAGASATDAAAKAAPSTPGPAAKPIDPENHQSRASFVRTEVKESSVTTGILDTIWPYFHKDDAAIGGFLNDDDQVWKLNWHWEWMIRSIDVALGAGISEDNASTLRGLQSELRDVPPDPPSGYWDDAVNGTVDTSDPAEIEARFDVVSSAKTRLKAVYEAEVIWEKSSKFDAHHWQRMYAPIMFPGTSPHGKGYAIDIEGDNAEIVRVSKALGAKKPFDEKAHVHVDFPSGVKTRDPKALADE